LKPAMFSTPAGRQAGRQARRQAGRQARRQAMHHQSRYHAIVWSKRVPTPVHPVAANGRLSSVRLLKVK
jgi:hypothetical protein